MALYSRALVTGASSGIGEEFARQLAGRGLDLVVVARRGDLLEALAGKLRSEHGVHVEVVEADLTDPRGLRRVEERVADETTPVDLVVNNAGRGIVKPFAESSRDDEDACIRLNVLALARLTHAALGAMIPRKAGGILNVSSIAGDIPNPGSATYSASKAFVTTLGQAIHYEAMPHGVHVTTLLPGFVRTDIVSDETSQVLPWFAWVDITKLVSEAIDAVEANKVLCIPTLRYKMAAHLLQLLPRAVVRKVSSRVDIGSSE